MKYIEKQINTLNINKTLIVTNTHLFNLIVLIILSAANNCQSTITTYKTSN